MKVIIFPLVHAAIIKNQSASPIAVSAIGENSEVLLSSVLPVGETMVFSDPAYQAVYFGNGAIYRSDYPTQNVIGTYISSSQHTIEVL